MCSIIKEEFEVEKFKLSGIDPKRLYIPSCNTVPKAVRWVLQGIFALYSFVLMLVSLSLSIKKYNNGKWFTYLTSWNYMLCTTYFITAFIINLKNGMSRRRNAITDSTIELNADNNAGYGTVEGNDETTTTSDYTFKCEEKFYWMLFSTSFIVCLVVVIIYWGFLTKSFAGDSALVIYLSVDRHGVIYLFLVIEYLFSDIPIRFLHFVYPCAFIFVYLMFNVIYWAITKNIVYTVLNWNKNPGLAAAFILVSLVITIVLNFVLFLVDLGLRKLFKCCS